jgi:putative ATPase
LFERAGCDALSGHPEGELALAQAVVYLALAPKSNAVYTAYGAVQADIEKTAAEPVPLHLRNAPTKLMKELGLRQGLSVRARCRGRVADMECLPFSGTSCGCKPSLRIHRQAKGP